MDGQFDWGAVIDGLNRDPNAPLAPTSPGSPPGAAPGQGAAPTALAPAPAPSSSSSGSDWGAAIDQLDAYHQSVAQGLTFNAAHGPAPDQAAKALSLSAETGIPASVVANNMPELEQRAQAVRNNAILQQNPELARWLSANPDAAGVAQDEYAKLGTFGKMAASFGAGLSDTATSNELARQYFAGQTAATSPTVAAMEKQVQDATTDPAHSGIVHWIGEQVGNILDPMEHAAPVAAGGALTGAGIGALAAGLPSGGTLAPVGTGVGLIGGAAAGFTAGMAADMFKTFYGNMSHRLDGVTDGAGNPISPTAKFGASLVSGLAGAALGTVGLGTVVPGMGDAATSLVDDAVTQAVARSTVAAALGSFARNVTVDAAKGAAQGGALGAAQGAVNVFAEQAARMVSGPGFATVLNDPDQRQAAVSELADNIGSMALLMGVTHAASPLGTLAGDLSRARQSTADVSRFQSLADGAAGTATRTRAPDQFQALVDQQLGGSAASHVYLPGDVVQSLYQDLGATPGEGDELLGFVPDLAQQLEQAQATGGDVVVPTAGYLTHLAGTDVSARLLPGRPRPAGWHFAERGAPVPGRLRLDAGGSRSARTGRLRDPAGTAISRPADRR